MLTDQSVIHAPELDGGTGWLNTDHPIHLKDLRGKIVLLDFWTFCCINCMHVIPDLKKLEAKYPNELVVIGVHSAKFNNEKDSSNIREAILRYGLEHPVVNDANFNIWHAYTVKSWPTLVLIDPDGNIVGSVQGEGNYAALDQSIAKTVAKFEKQGKVNRSPMHFALEKYKMASSILAFPGKISADAATKRLFISDSDHNRILIAKDNGTVAEQIGSGKQGLLDGDFNRATFHHPQGTYLAGYKLYIADTENHCIRVADLKEKTVSTIAGTGQQAPYRSTGGIGVKAPLNSPWDLVMLNDQLYIAMAGPHQIWSMNLKSGAVHPFAGSGRENIEDGPLKAAALAQPSGITTDGHKLFWVDSEVSAVRQAGTAENSSVTTIVGEGLFEFGDKDGVGKEARLQHPLGVTWHAGKLYVADSYNHKIKIVDPESKSCLTLFGTGKPGLVDGKSPQFSEPGGLTFLGETLYIADTNNNAIRIADLQAKSVSTMVLRNAKAVGSESATAIQPAAEQQDINTQKIEVPLQQIPADREGKLTIEIDLPKGCHLNTESNLSVSIPDTNDALIFESAGVGKSISVPSKLPIVVPFRSGKAGAKSTLPLAVTVYYCDDGPNAACRMKTLKVNVPIETVGSSAPADFGITLGVKE